jgi:hypothetical protein
MLKGPHDRRVPSGGAGRTGSVIEHPAKCQCTSFSDRHAGPIAKRENELDAGETRRRAWRRYGEPRPRIDDIERAERAKVIPVENRSPLDRPFEVTDR